MRMITRNSLSILISLLILIISIILYVFAPDKYSQSYCLLLFFIYLASSFLVLKSSIINKNYFNFHILFIISFLFVNFIYPIFIYPISPFYFPVYRFKFNHDIITKATALALIGSSSYGLGVLLQSKRSDHIRPAIETNFKTIQLLLNCLLYLFFISLFLFGGLDLIKAHFRSTAKIPPGLLLLFQVLLGLSVIIAFYSKSFKGTVIDFINKYNKPVILVFILFTVLFILSGDRGPAIQIVLIFIVAFTLFVRPISLKSLIVIVVSGMIFLTFISYARNQSSKNPSETGINIRKGLSNIRFDAFYDIGMDLIINNRNLYTGYEYVKKNGINYGKSMSYQIFAPFPMLPRLYAHIIFNSKPDDLATARILTRDSRAHYGLGTNIIGDLYMNFGLAGVMVFMFLLGNIVTILHRKAHTNNIYYIIAYTFMASLSVYMPRSTIMDPYRPIVWAIIIFQFLVLTRILLIQLTKENKD